MTTAQIICGDNEKQNEKLHCDYRSTNISSLHWTLDNMTTANPVTAQLPSGIPVMMQCHAGGNAPHFRECYSGSHLID